MIGETVNLASRLCNYAEPMHIDVSEAVVKAIREGAGIIFNEPNYVHMKGISAPVAVYQIQREQMGSVKEVNSLP